jgi:hypothetical protein
MFIDTQIFVFPSASTSLKTEYSVHILYWQITPFLPDIIVFSCLLWSFIVINSTFSRKSQEKIAKIVKNYNVKLKNRVPDCLIL